MAQVAMPDGTIVEMPDKLTPELGARLRAFNDASQKSPRPIEELSGDEVTNIGKAPDGSLLKQALVDAPTALLHHAMNLPHGIAQGVENAVNYGAQLFPDNPVSRAINKTVQADNAAMRQREAEYQASIPTNAASVTGAALGEIAPFTLNAVAVPLRAAGGLAERFISSHAPQAVLAGKAASGSVQGGIVGAAMPVTGEDYLDEKIKQLGYGVLTGGAIPVIAKGAGVVKDTANAIINPVFNPEQSAIEKLIQDAGGIEEAKAAIERAANAGNTISGQSFTLGQAGKNAGLAATERARAAVSPENFQALYQAQRDARLRALQGIGQDDVAVANAIEARDKAANSLYGKAFQSDAMRRDLAAQQLQKKAQTAAGGIDQELVRTASQQADDLATPGLRELAQRPGFAAAVNQAKTLAANKGIDLKDPLQSLQGLHYIKLALDDMLNPQAASALGRNASASIMDMRDKLSQELEKVAPLYGNARLTYADMSAPINQMKVGQALTDKLTGESVKYGANAKQQAEQFFRAMKNAPSIVKAETGVRQPLAKIMTPDQMATIKQVANELAKDVDLQNLGRGVGSDTTQKMARSNVLSDLVGLANNTKTGRMAMNVATMGAKERVNKQLDFMLQNPSKAKEAISRMTAPEKGRMLKLLESNALTSQLINSASKP